MKKIAYKKETYKGYTIHTRGYAKGRGVYSTGYNRKDVMQPIRCYGDTKAEAVKRVKGFIDARTFKG